MCTDTIFEPSYKRSFAFIAIITSVFSLLCSFSGYIALPFASAFYATLLTYEKKDKRIFSYLIPIVFFFINLALNGLLSLEGVAYVIIGIIIYFSYKRGLSKGEAALYVTAATFVMILLSLFFVAFYAIESVDFGLAIEFYSDLIAKEKEAFVDFMSTSKEIVNGIPLTTISAAEAEVLYDAIVLLTFPVLVIIAFLITGLAFKTFSLNLKHFSENKEKISSWHFGTNNLLAYFYIIISIVNIFTSYSDEIYAIVITFIALVLSVIYAYLGFKFLFWIFKRRFNPILCFVVVVLLFSLFGNTVVNILSFVGVYYTIASNNMFSKGTPKSHN